MSLGEARGRWLGPRRHSLAWSFPSCWRRLATVQPAAGTLVWPGLAAESLETSSNSPRPLAINKAERLGACSRVAIKAGTWPVAAAMSPAGARLASRSSWALVKAGLRARVRDAANSPAKASRSWSLARVSSRLAWSAWIRERRKPLPRIKGRISSTRVTWKERGRRSRQASGTQEPMKSRLRRAIGVASGLGSRRGLVLGDPGGPVTL